MIEKYVIRITDEFGTVFSKGTNDHEEISSLVKMWLENSSGNEIQEIVIEVN